MQHNIEAIKDKSNERRKQFVPKKNNRKSYLSKNSGHYYFLF